jgi:hypothetical protein
LLISRAFSCRIQWLPLCVNCDERETKLQLHRQPNVLGPYFDSYCEQ